MSRDVPHPWADDPLRPRVERAVGAILAAGKAVAPVDVLVRMGNLSKQDLEAWRRGDVPYLERVIHGSLPKLSRLLRILRWHAHDLNLVPRTTVYVQVRGRKRGRRRPRLRFTKTGDRKLEEAYGRHFVWPGKGPFHYPPWMKEVASEKPTDR